MLKNEIEQGTGRRKADLVLKNGRFVNVFTGEVTAADIAVCGGKIVGFGAYEGEEDQSDDDDELTPSTEEGGVKRPGWPREEKMVRGRG